MHGYVHKNYGEEESYLSLVKKCDNGLQINVNTYFSTSTFLEYQKEIVTDFFGSILDSLGNTDTIMQDKEVKDFFEKELQNLNASLEAFAIKIDQKERFRIKGIIWLVYQGVLMASMIGDVSLFILRNQKIHYSMNNDTRVEGKIDIFSDFIEGELDFHDTILVLGTNYKHILDKKDLKDINDILKTSDINLLEFLESLFTAKISLEELCFILSYDYHNSSDNVGILQRKKRDQLGEKVYKNVQRGLVKNKYFVTVGILSLVVLFLGFNILRDMFATQTDIPQIETEDGKVEVVTPETIEKDIDRFQRLEPTSSEKSRVYKTIMEKLQHLDSIGRRPEDVAKLKKIVQNKYYEGFNVIYKNDIDKDVDTPRVYTFSPQEKETLGKPASLLYSTTMYIAGTKGAVLGAISNDIRGTQIGYSLLGTLVSCSFDLTRQGLFCFDTANEITRITKGATQKVIIQKPEVPAGSVETTTQPEFTTPIVDIDVFNKNSLYVLHANPDLTVEGKYVTKYVNVLGKYNEFQPGTEYKIAGEMGSGENLELTNFSIDGSFLARSSKEKGLYQLWRDKAFNIRSVAMVGGDMLEDSYSTGVTVIAPATSKYIFFFDKTNQTFTVYKSNPAKTNERYAYGYALTYVFRFKFDLSTPVLDATVPDEKVESPYLYLLTDNGIHQISLTEFIKSYDK